jgi:hypothetical protein
MMVIMRRLILEGVREAFQQRLDGARAEGLARAPMGEFDHGGIKDLALLIAPHRAFLGELRLCGHTDPSAVAVRTRMHRAVAKAHAQLWN